MDPYLEVLDVLTKPSVEADRVVFAALIEGRNLEPLPSSWTSTSWAGDTAAWGDSGWADYCPKTPCRLGSPNQRQDFCASESGEPLPSSAPGLQRPGWKLLDAAHPDAVQPALEIGRLGAAFKGWLSWQVETRPDCRTVMSTTYTYAFRMMRWEWAGPDAERPGTKTIADFIGTSGRTRIGKVDVPDEGRTVLRVTNYAAGPCSFSLWPDWSARKLLVPITGTLPNESAAFEWAMGYPAVTDGVMDTTCASWWATFERRGPPYD